MGRSLNSVYLKNWIAGYALAMGLGLIFCSVLVSHWSKSVALGYLLLPSSLAVAPLFHLTIYGLIYRGKGASPAYTRHTATLAAMALSPVLATILIGVYIYPEVHTVYGGGRPLVANLVLTNEGIAAWRQISGSTLKGRESVATNLEILYDSDSHLVVRLKNFSPETGPLAVIDRKVVIAVLPGTPSLDR